MIAEIGVSAEIAGWLACAAFLVWMANGLFRLAQNVRGAEPTPSNPDLGASVQLLEKSLNVVQRDLNKLDVEVLKNREHNETLLTSQTSALYERVKHVEENLNRKIEDMPEKIMRLMKLAQPENWIKTK